MKKRIIGCILLGLMVCTSSTTVFAGTWEQTGPSYDRYWKYVKDDGNYAKNEWVYYNNSWYYLDEHERMADNRQNWKMPGSKYTYYFYASGKMATGFIRDTESNYFSDALMFADKDGHGITGPFIVDGQLYYISPKSGIAEADFTSKNGIITLYNDVTKQRDEIPCMIDKVKVFDRNGKPFTTNSKLFTEVKYIPEYDSNGNLVGEIKNSTDWRALE
jgi:hypothetical protein